MKTSKCCFPFVCDCFCQCMTDFREKSILLEGVSGTFSNAKAEVKDDSEGKLQMHPLYLPCTLLPGDSCYQTKNKRKNNPGV